MKSGIIIFNGVLLLLIGVLFYLHFSSKGSTPKSVQPKVAGAAATSPAAAADFKIAYFEMDSLESSFAMVKDVKAELSRKENAINNEMAQLERSYRERANRYQSQAQTMTQVQSEAAMKDMQQLEQQIRSKKQSLDQDYQDFYMRRMKDVKTKIEDYLQQYNTTKGYSYIFAYEPGLFYYRDTAYNITGDVIKGLNVAYKKK